MRPATTTATEARARAREKLARPYARRLIPQEEGGFTGTIHELPGCFAEGESADETLAALDAAAAAWVTAALDSGRPVPDPLDLGEYSGKIALRLPRSLHKMAAELAALERVSLNHLLTSAIATHVGQLAGLRSATAEVRYACYEFGRHTQKLVGAVVWAKDAIATTGQNQVPYVTDSVVLGTRLMPVLPTSFAISHDN